MTMSVERAQELLGITVVRDTQTIRDAYLEKRRALPRHQGNVDPAALVELQEASKVLLDEVKRQESANSQRTLSDIKYNVTLGIPLTDIPPETVVNTVYDYLYELAFSGKKEPAYAKLLALLPSNMLFRLAAGYFRDRQLSDAGIHPALVNRLSELTDEELCELIGKFSKAHAAIPETLRVALTTRIQLINSVMRIMRVFADELAGDVFFKSIPPDFFIIYGRDLTCDPHPDLVIFINEAKNPSSTLFSNSSSSESSDDTPKNYDFKNRKFSQEFVDDNKGDFSGKDFSNSDFEGLFAMQINFSGSNFTYAKFEKATLFANDFSNSKFYGAYLSEADLSHSDLDSADFYCADLRKANLEYCKLYNTRFCYSDLEGANLSKASMSRGLGIFEWLADFTGANCRNAKFTGASFGDGTSFKNADCSGADFSCAWFMRGLYLKGIIVDDTTNFTDTIFEKYPKWFFAHIGDFAKETAVNLLKKFCSDSGNDSFIKGFLEAFEAEADPHGDNFDKIYNKLYTFEKSKVSLTWIVRSVTPKSWDLISDILDFAERVDPKRTGLRARPTKPPPAYTPSPS